MGIKVKVNKWITIFLILSIVGYVYYPLYTLIFDIIVILIAIYQLRKMGLRTKIRFFKNKK